MGCATQAQQLDVSGVALAIFFVTLAVWPWFVMIVSLPAPPSTLFLTFGPCVALVVAVMILTYGKSPSSR